MFQDLTIYSGVDSVICPFKFREASGTFDDKCLSQQSQVIGGLVVLRQLLQSHPGAHSLGVPVAALHIVHFGHQQQSLIQVPGLEGQEGIRGTQGKVQLQELCAIMRFLFYKVKSGKKAEAERMSGLDDAG